MTREEILMQAIKQQYRSVRSFSCETGIPNSTLASMFKKGIGGTAVDTVLRVCKSLNIDIYQLAEPQLGHTPSMTQDDKKLLQDFYRLDSHGQQLVRLIIEHELQRTAATEVTPAQTAMPVPEMSVVRNKKDLPCEEATRPTRTVRLYYMAASAGTGQFLEDEEYEVVAVGEDVPYNVDFGIWIHGDSMEPQIHDNDIVWVKKQDNLESGQIGIFILNGDAYCKKLVDQNGKYRLVSLNRKYKDIMINEYDQLSVVGRVIKTSPYPD